MRFSISLLALIASLASISVARADGVGELNLYRPTESAEDGFGVGRPTDLGHLRFGARLELDYARDPLVVEVEDAGQTSTTHVVQDQLVGHVVGSVGLFNRLILTLGLPVSFLMSGDSLDVASLSSDGTSLGDLWLGARVRFFGGRSDAFVLGAAANLSFPTAGAANDNQRLAGSPGVSGRIRLLAEARWKQFLRVSADVGVQLRPQRVLLTPPVDDGELYGALGYGLIYGVDVAVPILRDGDADRLVAHLDLRGTILDFRTVGYQQGNSIEIALGAKYHHSSGLRLGASVGPGLFAGIGTPDVRAVFMVGYESPAPAEQAPQEEPPHEETPQPVDVVASDTDGDGVSDDQDRCPRDPEDRDGFEDADGCVDPDNDADGVVDGVDRCPAQAGPPENRGCPDHDADGDGIVDRLDNCPTESGTRQNHGCREAQLVHITAERIVISDRIYFESDRATIRTQSFALLENIASVMRSHPDIAVRVEGHTDSRGDDQHNLQLSQQRSEAVMRFLVEHGVEARRLRAIGYGEEWPIVQDARTEEQHSANRRVEFNIVREEDLDADGGQAQ